MSSARARLGRAVMASLTYVAVVMPIDLAIGANFGFIGKR
jgi:hypothetical protein